MVMHSVSRSSPLQVSCPAMGAYLHRLSIDLPIVLVIALSLSFIILHFISSNWPSSHNMQGFHLRGGDTVLKRSGN